MSKRLGNALWGATLGLLAGMVCTALIMFLAIMYVEVSPVVTVGIVCCIAFGAYAGWNRRWGL